jgi:hypothetical protein
MRRGIAAGSRTAAARSPYPRGTWRASRHGAAAPFVSIGRGAAPSGPLTSGRAVAVSRRCGAPSPQGVGRRRRAVPTLREHGALRAMVRQHPSCQLVGAPSGLLTSGRAVAVSRRCGAASPQGVGRRRRAVPTLGGTWGASRHGAAAPFVSIGGGAAPSGPHFHCGLPSRSREAHKLEPDFFMRMGHGRLSEPEASRPCHSARISSFPSCGPDGIRGSRSGCPG